MRANIVDPRELHHRHPDRRANDGTALAQNHISSRPLAVFAGIWCNWTSVRNVKEGLTTNDLYGFLTTEPNGEVGEVHPKAMQVILRTAEEIETWLTAPTEEALKLQGPLSDGSRPW